MKTIQDFAEKVQADVLKDMNKTHPERLGEYPDMWVKDSQTTIVPGKKYTKVDVGKSGRFMVVNETGEIFGIKGYGVIHLGHFYGTLETIDNYFWGRYDVVKINNAPAPVVVVEKETPIKNEAPKNLKTQKIIDYFHTLRFDENHHLGLGDIRLTIAQQEEIVSMVEEILQPKTAPIPYATKEARRQFRLNKAAQRNYKNCKRDGRAMYY